MADKLVIGMLNGLAKQQYYNEKEITKEFLKEQLYPDLTLDEFDMILEKYTSLLRNLVYSDMEMKQLEAYLTSQMKRKPDFLTEGESAAVIKFWKLNKQKIHTIVSEEASWNDKLKAMKWRIDVNYDNSDVTNEPKVIFELQTQRKVPVRLDDKFMFEVDNDKLSNLISQVECIETKIKDIIQ